MRKYLTISVAAALLAIGLPAGATEFEIKMLNKGAEGAINQQCACGRLTTPRIPLRCCAGSPRQSVIDPAQRPTLPGAGKLYALGDFPRRFKRFKVQRCGSLRWQSSLRLSSR